jgi:hypothetical protein
MRIIIEDDYRFVAPGPGMGMPGQPTVMAPPYNLPSAQQIPQYSPPQQLPQPAQAPITSVKSAGEPASHLHQFVNAATRVQSTPMTAAGAAVGLGPPEIINIGPAPDWLRRLTLTALVPATQPQ